MSQTPSLCGGFLTDKRSMVAFVWSVTTVLTIFAFATAIVLTVKVHMHYNYLQQFYDGDDWYQASDSYYNYDNNQDENENENNESQDEKNRDEIRDSYMLLSSMSAKSVTFVAVYTMILATALSMYGSLAIVGFTSLRGVYIAPCFSIGSNKLRVGIFGGMIVIFANLMLVCAVVLGEVKVCTILVCIFCICIGARNELRLFCRVLSFWFRPSISVDPRCQFLIIFLNHLCSLFFVPNKQFVTPLQLSVFGIFVLFLLEQLG